MSSSKTLGRIDDLKDGRTDIMSDLLSPWPLSRFMSLRIDRLSPVKFLEILLSCIRNTDEE